VTVRVVDVRTDTALNTVASIGTPSALHHAAGVTVWLRRSQTREIIVELRVAIHKLA